MEKDDTKFRRAINIRKRVAIGLYTLATPAEYRSIGNIFGVSKGSVMNCFKSLVYAINNSQLRSTYLKVPSMEEFESIAKGFQERTGYPNCCGAIDGSHIRIKVPVDQRSSYYSHQCNYSCLLLAICDHRMRFYWLTTGHPGRSGDAGTFNTTQFYSQLNSNTVLPSSNLTLNGVQIPYHLIGDSAFARTSWLSKPFSQSVNQTNQVKGYNKILSRTRVTIENAFGRLKSRFRRIMKDPFECKTIDVPVVITAAVILHNIYTILHNICETTGDIYYEEWHQEVQNAFSRFTNQSQNETEQTDYRHAMGSYFVENNLV